QHVEGQPWPDGDFLPVTHAHITGHRPSVRSGARSKVCETALWRRLMCAASHNRLGEWLAPGRADAPAYRCPTIRRAVPRAVTQTRGFLRSLRMSAGSRPGFL